VVSQGKAQAPPQLIGGQVSVISPALRDIHQLAGPLASQIPRGPAI
jgi:hypothetical protein